MCVTHIRSGFASSKKGGVLLNFDANYGITDFSNVEDLRKIMHITHSEMT